MPKETIQFSLPRFQGAVRYITLFTLGIWVTVIVLFAFDKPDAALLLRIGELNPDRVFHGWVWQMLTYAVVHVDAWHVIFALMGVFFIGSSVQERVGSRAFTELYLFSSVVAGLVGSLLSLTGHVGLGSALGAGAAVNGVLMVFYLLNRDASIYLMPFPIQVPVLWVVILVGGVETAYFVLTNFSLFFLAQLLGLGAGVLWHRMMWRRASVFGALSTSFAVVGNNYQRWKRRRAGKKFQVYMRKHNPDAKDNDPKGYIDETGN